MQLKPVSRHLQLIEEKGKLEERQLLARWRGELGAFAGCFDEIIRQRHCALEIGLESELSLKFVIKRRSLTPAQGLIRLLPDLREPVASVAERVLGESLDFHLGIKATSRHLNREIYIYCDPHHSFEDILADMNIPHPEPDMPVAFFGINEEGSISAYYASPRTREIEQSTHMLTRRLETELKTSLKESVSGHWQHLRFTQRQWRPAKIGVEFAQPPAELVTRVISHYRPPWYRHLVPRRQLLQMAVAYDPEDNRPAWYFTVC